jgi:hypothetical protein
MNLYTVLVFAHVLGGVGIFAAMGIEGVSLARLREAETAADARASFRWLALPARFGPVVMLTTVGTGIWMMVVGWSHQAWMPTAFGAVVAMAVLGGAVTGRRMRRLRDALEGSGEALSDDARAGLSSGALAASLRLRIALGVGIIALMTVKPGLVGSLVTLVTAAAAGLVAAGLAVPSRGGRVAGTREA